MKFGPVPVAEAHGAILAHRLRLPGGTLKKGRVLDAGDQARLREAGHESVVAVRLEPGDVPEDAAAARLAAAVGGSGRGRAAGVHQSAAFTGRSNLFADAEGLLVVDEARLERLNFVCEALTVATLRSFTPVTARQMVATVKIITFAAPEPELRAWEAIAHAGGPVVEVRPFRGRLVGLLQTRLPGIRSSVLDKATCVLGRRVARYGCRLGVERRCAHEAPAVAAALDELLAAGAELVLIVGASAIVDRRDVVPAAIERIGGTVEHFGMPVDPGNLMLLARRGRVPIIGLPGSARSPQRSGFDFVLPRLAADVAVTPADIVRMGAYGLLKEHAERAAPRAGSASRAGSAPEAASARGDRARGDRARVAAIVLAAGQSRRMGARNKLLERVDGVPMVARVVDAVTRSRAGPVIVVTGHERARVAAALAGYDVQLVHNPAYAEGLGASLARGVGALPPGVQGALVCLGDMPDVAPAHIDRLIAAFDPVAGPSICVPTYRGKRGNPVLLGERFFAAMAAVRGDAGARYLVGDHPEAVGEVAMDDPAVLTDVDSPAALRDLLAGREARAASEAAGGE